MPFRIRYPGNAPGLNLAAIVERLSDGFIWDAGAASPGFVQAPTKPAVPLPPNPTILNRYDATLPATGWSDGDYLVSIVEAAAPTYVVQLLRNTLVGGDDISPNWSKLVPAAVGAAFAKALGTIPAT